MMDMRHPADWPTPARALLCMAAFLLAVLLGWQSYLQPSLARLASGAQQARELKTAYKIKTGKALDLAQLQQRLQRTHEDLRVLRQQLSQPGDAMLAAIASAAQARGLHFELARPGQSEIGTEYTTHTLAIRLSGSYHALGHFAADLAIARPIVVLSELQLSAVGAGIVAIDAVALSFQHNDDAADNNKQKNHTASARAAP